MEYISARDAALRWGTHIRVVQNLCRAGRVVGARKYGNVWMLPEDSVKPDDPRRARRGGTGTRPEYDGCGLLTMASVALPLASPPLPETLVPDEAAGRQLAAEFAFLRGDLAAALQAFHNTGRANSMTLCAATLTIAAASRTDGWAAFCEAEAFLQELIATGSERERLPAEIAMATASLSQFATELAPEWILNAMFSYAPVRSRPMSVYLYAKSLQGRHRPDELLAICKTARALWARDDCFTMLDVYLSLLLAAACHTKGDAAGCRRALEQAAEIALPYGFITPFAEYRQTMDAEMDALLRERAPELLEPVQALGRQMWDSWSVFHTRFIRSRMAKLLTPQQLLTARQIAKGASYREAARELGVTQNELKQMLSAVYQKLFISDRTELVRFML